MNVTLQNDGTLTIPLSGKSNSIDVLAESKDLLDESKSVVFDLAEKDIIVSQDIGFLLAIYKQSRHHNCAIINANQSVVDILTMAQIHNLIELRN